MGLSQWHCFVKKEVILIPPKGSSETTVEFMDLRVINKFGNLFNYTACKGFTQTCATVCPLIGLVHDGHSPHRAAHRRARTPLGHIISLIYTHSFSPPCLMEHVYSLDSGQPLTLSDGLCTLPNVIADTDHWVYKHKVAITKDHPFSSIQSLLIPTRKCSPNCWPLSSLNLNVPSFKYVMPL